MRRTFADEISKYDVTILTADLGYKLFDNNPKVINVGASEQAMVGIAIGYALEKKIAVCYSITPFVLYRPFEWIRYINQHKIPIILVGSGFCNDYIRDGFSHDATGAEDYLKLLNNFKVYFPKEKEEIKELIKTVINNNRPSFIILRR